MVNEWTWKNLTICAVVRCGLGGGITRVRTTKINPNRLKKITTLHQQIHWSILLRGL